MGFIKLEKKDEPLNEVYQKVLEYNQKHRGCIAWRIRKHCEVINMHLNPDEHVLFAFAGQKNYSFTDIFSTCVVALTNKRLLIGQKGLFFGYYLTSITPDLYNDLKVHQSLLWGRVIIDTVKEKVIISNIDKHGLDDIETSITEYMIKEKKKYYSNENKN